MKVIYPCLVMWCSDHIITVLCRFVESIKVRFLVPGCSTENKVNFKGGEYKNRHDLRFCCTSPKDFRSTGHQKESFISKKLYKKKRDRFRSLIPFECVKWFTPPSGMSKPSPLLKGGHLSSCTFNNHSLTSRCFTSRVWWMPPNLHSLK